MIKNFQNSRTWSVSKILFKVIVILLMIGWNMNCFGQDTLVMRNENSIICKVVEIWPEEIRYKKIENMEGPVYVVMKTEIDKIIYKGGLTESFEFQKPWFVPAPNSPVQVVSNIPAQSETNTFIQPQKISLIKDGNKYLLDNKPLSEYQMQKKILELNNPEITVHIKDARTARGLQYIGFAAIPFGFVGLVELLGQGNQSSSRYGGILIGLGAFSIGTSIYFQCDRKKNNEEIYKLYNQNY